MTAGPLAAEMFFDDGSGVAGSPVGSRDVWVADLDGDGLADILAADQDSLDWYRNEGGTPPFFSAQSPIRTGMPAHVESLDTADIDGDSDLDVLITQSGEDSVYWYENGLGDGSIWNEHTISDGISEGRDALAADLDGDGDLDVVAASSDDDLVLWFESDGGSPPSFTERVVAATVDAVIDLAVGDLDGDGDPDLVAGGFADGRIAWLENSDGDALSWTEHEVFDHVGNLVNVEVADLDGDFDLDLVATYQGIAPGAAGLLRIYNEGGDPLLFVADSVPSDARSGLSVTDIDRDGDTDIVSTGGNRIYYTINLGHRIFVHTQVCCSTGDLTQAKSVFAANLDGDPEREIVGSWDSSGLYWYDYLGSPCPVTTTIAEVSPSPSGHRQWASFSTDVIGLPEARSLEGEMVWLADGSELGTSRVIPLPGTGSEHYSFLLTDRLELTEPEPQEITITASYRGEETWEGIGVPDCAGLPVAIEIQPYTHTLVQEWVDDPPSNPWPGTIEVSEPTAVFGEPLTATVDWFAPDSGTENLRGDLAFFDESGLLSTSLYYNAPPGGTPDDWQGTKRIAHMGIGLHQLEARYYGREGALDATASVEILRPKNPTTLRISPNRLVTTTGRDVVLRACVVRAAGFTDVAPTGDITMSSTTMDFEQELIVDVEGCAEFLVPALPEGGQSFVAFYSGDDSFEPADETREITVVPAQPFGLGEPSRLARILGGTGSAPVGVRVRHDNFPDGGQIGHPPGVRSDQPDLFLQVLFRSREQTGSPLSGIAELRINGAPVALHSTADTDQNPRAIRVATFGPLELSDGVFVVEGAYLGDEVHAPAVSEPVMLAVRNGRYHTPKSWKTDLGDRDFELTVRSYPVSPVAGEPMTLDVRIEPVEPAALDSGVPTGVVALFLDGEILGEAFVNGLNATLHLSQAPPAGDWELEAVYSGSWTDAPRTSTGHTLRVFETASTTLATSASPTATTGETVKLVAYAYEPSHGLATPTGEVLFYLADRELGTASLFDGRALLEWQTVEVDENGDPLLECDPIDPESCFTVKLPPGSYPLTAVYSGDAVHAPSAWLFEQELVVPDQDQFVRYAMMQLAELTYEDLGDPFAEGGLAERIAEHFDLELIAAYDRLESAAEQIDPSGRLSCLPELSELLGTCHPLDVAFRSSFVVAKNDSVVVFVFRGTDCGEEPDGVDCANTQVNDAGEPGFWEIPGADPIVAHPGWTWMADRLYEGIAGFEGVRELVESHRDAGQAVYLGGHSLGGALSAALMMRLAKDGLASPGDRVYEFGSPRQGAFNDFAFVFDGSARTFEEVYADEVLGAGARVFITEGDKDRVPAETGCATRENYLARAGYEQLFLEILLDVASSYSDIRDAPQVALDAARTVAERIGLQLLSEIHFDDILNEISYFFGGGTVIPPPPPPYVPIGYSLAPLVGRTQFDIDLTQPNPDDKHCAGFEEGGLFEYHDSKEYLRFNLDTLEASDGRFYFPDGRNPHQPFEGVRSLKLQAPLDLFRPLVGSPAQLRLAIRRELLGRR